MKMVAPARPTQTDHFELVLKVVSPFQSGEPAKAGPPLNGIASDASGVTGSFKAPRPKARGLGVFALLSFQRPTPWAAGA
jgi:hypothetical protein